MADDTKYPTRIAPYGLRMPDDLKARVQAAADANNRSMNAEIVARLEGSFLTPPGIIAAYHGNKPVPIPDLQQIIEISVRAAMKQIRDENAD